ncbi:MAG: flagellar basal body P-ring formation chaperone FlgA [Candidatus Krumholzibacteriia bacterium]
MRRLTWPAAVAALVLGSAPAGAWDLVLPDTVTVAGTTATVADLARGPVPAAVAPVVVHAGGVPGTCVTVSDRGVLRRLVSAGVAGGVRMRGAGECVVVFAGRLVGTDELHEAARRAVQPLVPAARPGAPDSWFELELPARQLPAAAAGWQLEVRRTQPLEPGRNTVRFELVAGQRREAFPGAVVLHAYAEVPTARLAVPREAPLAEDQFTWTWQDLAELPTGAVSGRESLAGAAVARTLAAGDALRSSDLREIPLVRAGDPVDLRVVRGGVAVTVRCTARQPGCLGQTIPVRNELNGRLVNARVAGPGLVEWRR